MSYFAKFPGIPRGPARRLWGLGVGLLVLPLLTGCPKGPLKPTTGVSHGKPPTDNELHFDERYLDSMSLGPPYSTRTQRQIAIYQQLSRLEMSKPLSERYGYRVDTTGQYKIHSPVSEVVGDNPGADFPNEATLRRDIYRKIDSLKVLENIPVTPH